MGDRQIHAGFCAGLTSAAAVQLRTGPHLAAFPNANAIIAYLQFTAKVNDDGMIKMDCEVSVNFSLQVRCYCAKENLELRTKFHIAE